MSLHNTFRINGVDLEIEYEYTPEEYGDIDSPPIPEEFYLTSVKVGDVDIIDLIDRGIYCLTDQVQEQLETMAEEVET